MFRFVTFAEMIKELHKRSGLGVKEYAEAVNYSTPHVSNVLNDKQPGSLKILQACLRHAKIELEDCLELPERRVFRTKFLHIADGILKRNDDYGHRLRDMIQDTERHIRHDHAEPRKRQA